METATNLETTAPIEVGMSVTQLNAVARHVREIVDFDALPLVEVLVLRGSKIVLHDHRLL